MKPLEFQQELLFGLENLQKVKSEVDAFQKETGSTEMRQSALAYAGMGYFNALEHLMIRVLKFHRITIPTGSTSHQMILTAFQKQTSDLEIDPALYDAIKRLLGFRHVANKIYGFLINPLKLTEIVAVIQEHHTRLVELFSGISHRAFSDKT